MDFKDYQKETLTTANYPPIGHPCIYPSLGLANEAGEVLGKIKKVFRDDGGKFTKDKLSAIGDFMITELDTYQEEAIKTRKKMDTLESNKYCAMKLCEEAGEVTSIIAKHAYHDKTFNIEDLKNELSDIMWYVANMANVNGLKLSEIATFNIEKLRNRHGENYNPEFYTK